KKLIGIFAALALIMLTGAGGYITFEGWAPLDALYMTVITLSSVGFQEVHPLSDKGRVFTMALILCGSGVLIYGISIITAFIVEGELTDALRRRKMQKRIDRLEGHYIVCGADQTGRYVIDELLRTQRRFTVIDRDAAKIRDLLSREILCVEGDATHDAVLLNAGIRRAAGFITALHSDAENLFTVITARRLNPGLRIISKAVDEESVQKIRSVGADSVVMPNFIGGLRMVSEMIRPSVVNFLDIMLRAKDRTIRVEEVALENTSPFAGRQLGETGALGIEGVTVVALANKEGGSYHFNPPQSRVLTGRDVLIVMGDVERINSLRLKAQPPAS
ncbi:MAG: potassium channel protein, partial [Nitrospiraceae bacterium]|nr:potassium channel protein [Nitrospiraceae bacterium]